VVVVVVVVRVINHGGWDVRDMYHTNKSSIGKTESKTQLVRSRHRWVNNTEMDIREIGCDGADWIQLAQDGGQQQALVNTVKETSGSIKRGIFLTS